MATAIIYGLFVHLNNDAEETCIVSGSFKEVSAEQAELKQGHIAQLYGRESEPDEY